eukprot:Colp12_sorted_trinity150504_noHs@16891
MFGQQDPDFSRSTGFLLAPHAAKADIEIIVSGTDFEVTAFGGSKYAVFVHRGSYEGLGASWGKAFGTIAERGMKPTMGFYSYEMYMNDPSKTKEEDLITEIHIPVSN